MKKIAIIGTVGIGKSTVTKELEKLSLEVNESFHFFEEKEKYTYLKKAYDDMSKYAFILQMDFLMARLRMVNDETKNSDYIFYDRSYIDDYFYAKESFLRGELSEEEFDIYNKCFESFHDITKQDGNELDVVVILQQPQPGLANERRNNRNRFEGREVDRDHFSRIDEYYDSEEAQEWIKKYCKNIIVIKNVDSKETARKIIDETTK